MSVDAAPRHYDPMVVQVKQSLERAVATNADPEVIEGLKTALRYADMREEYAVQFSSRESDTCRKIAEATASHPWSELKKQGKTTWDLTPRMLSGSLEGQFLKSLISGQRAVRVLDVGTFTGYSALSMAEALPADGQVVTLDMDPYLLHFNQPFFDASPHGAKITMKLGQAVALMREMAKDGQKFDLIFLDADKYEYIEYIKIAFDEGLLTQSGTVAVDNAFRNGMSYLTTDDAPDVARVFGTYVTRDQRLHKVLVPIRDGVMLIRRLSEVDRDHPK